MGRGSLSFRLLIASVVVLIAFLGFGGAALERAFKTAVESEMHNRLQIYVYALLSAATRDQEEEIRLTRTLPESRFSTPGSGLYGFVFNNDGVLIWRSGSSLDVIVPYISVSPGEAEVLPLSAESSSRLALYYSVVWEGKDDTDQTYTFVVAENQDALDEKIADFRDTLWLWLIGTGVLLVAAQYAVLRWGLRPLSHIAKDLQAIESGENTRLDSVYPGEIKGLVENLNALLDSERACLDRYRNSLADLAHSLKTPLTIVRGCIENDAVSKQTRQEMEEQLLRLDEIVDYQLRRAAAHGQNRLSNSFLVIPVTEKIIESLDKVYTTKGVNCLMNGEETVSSIGCDEGDWYEIAGNLIDNAYKWCYSKVTITIESTLHSGKSALHLVVEDDGPGVPRSKLGQVLGRGIRADENKLGHGVGLSIVKELVTLSGGEINVDKSRYGGALFEIWLPSAS